MGGGVREQGEQEGKVKEGGVGPKWGGARERSPVPGDLETDL